MKRNMSFAGFQLSRAVFDLCYELLFSAYSYYYIVEINMFFGFVCCFPSYVVEHNHEFLWRFVDNFDFDFCNLLSLHFHVRMMRRCRS